ncbi:hypothetical protein BLA60_36900 [Actinophytocola xinjiangensis]|uniref:Acyl-CoA dehydrogenase/oxidase C-terminal domain-containing protein n=1 Tax=Actinophytocola xinjiangensis TaxID=485602 RepID=A0A7Z1AV40_9PSEU|nr:acyl-CoA dehydrogenase family protein [Actinophytocola xinjiangensis]OLF05239.1 hypothetical protein BLA60_36900 [Actinophytocola xinjiangensis]
MSLVDRARSATTLAGGLGTILDSGLPAPAPAGHTLVPAGHPGQPLAHPLAGWEGLALVRAERVSCPEAVRLLAAVRIGLTERMLRAAVEHLTGRVADGRPLVDHPVLRGELADLTATLALCWQGLGTGTSTAALHATLDRAGWATSVLFGASGYLRDHPVRCLYLAELVHDTWSDHVGLA